MKLLLPSQTSGLHQRFRFIAVWEAKESKSVRSRIRDALLDVERALAIYYNGRAKITFTVMDENILVALFEKTRIALAKVRRRHKSDLTPPDLPPSWTPDKAKMLVALLRNLDAIADIDLKKTKLRWAEDALGIALDAVDEMLFRILQAMRDLRLQTAA